MNAKSTTKDSERRQFSRVPFATDARLFSSDFQWKCTLLDISLKGALVAPPAHAVLKAGAKCRLEVPLDSDDHVIRMDVIVAHAEKTRTGLKCEHIDLDSITHLKRLLELNLGDPELVHRELGQLG